MWHPTSKSVLQVVYVSFQIPQVRLNSSLLIHMKVLYFSTIQLERHLYFDTRSGGLVMNMQSAVWNSAHRGVH